MRFLFLAFLLVPLLEMLLLFEVSDRIGGLWTLSLVVLTAVVGVQILKQQGFSTLLRARSRLASGELPAQEILEGMMLAAAGAMLLTPGFLTDTIGFIFLCGPMRRPLASRLISAGVVRSVRVGGTGFETWSGSYQSPPRRGTTVEGEFTNHADSVLDKPKCSSE
ncbi:MAG: FxsA family protein [Gammaproteobacteria bacterium]|nr:FxsA family protein [Gammaproteobacteria bacterium]MCY4355901.1 FxsA family protein [Gammaproteobacteria bacterium]